MLIWLYESPTLTWHQQQLLFWETSDTQLHSHQDFKSHFSSVTDRWVLMRSHGPPGVQTVLWKGGEASQSINPSRRQMFRCFWKSCQQITCMSWHWIAFESCRWLKLWDGAMTSSGPCASTLLIQCVILCNKHLARRRDYEIRKSLEQEKKTWTSALQK